MRRQGLTILFIMILYTGLVAQVPQKFNYQAVVRYSNGELIQDERISLRVSINQGGIDGTAIYSEIHYVSTNDFGLINLEIGSGTGGQDFGSIDWSNEDGLWLKVEVDASGGTDYEFMGGMQLISVPYAIYAGKAASAPPVLPIMSDSERQIMENPATGLMILNSTTNKINIKKEDGWYELSGEEKIVESFSCGQNLVDSRDQQSYKTVQIGSQCWMAENINVGQMIQGNVEMTNNGVIEKYCYDNSSALCDTYGGLYQWNELMSYQKAQSSQGICPEGWHIPSDGEVQELEIALGMSASTAALANVWRGSNQGSRMAPGGDSGYDALYAGRRVTGGLYSAINDYEYLYTSSESGGNAWRRCLRADDTRVGRYDTFPKTYGMSVRCILD